MVNATDPTFADLSEWERNGQIVFLPVGGSNLKTWTNRLRHLGHKEFHLYDREDRFIAEDRARIVAAINRRSDCFAVLTQRRALENYIHPKVVAQALGIDVQFGDGDDVPEVVAKELLRQANGPAWEDLSPRGRKRLKDRGKKRLNNEAVGLMTYELLRDWDPRGEVIGWIEAIRRLVINK